MLVLSRLIDESIIIELNGVKVTVMVVGVRGNKVRIGIKAPPEVSVDREEIWERKHGHPEEGTETSHIPV